MRKPTVTQLVDMLDKPALVRWANKIGLQGTSLDTYRSQKKMDGEDIHEQINMFFTNGTPFKDPETVFRFTALMSDKKVISSEKEIETEWFTGRYDLLVDISDKKFLIDFKGGDGVYLETILQLVAYRMAEPCDHIAVVQVPEMKFRPLYWVKDFTPYEEILKSLSNIYVLKKQVGE